jgi:hypothetical protein
MANLKPDCPHPSDPLSLYLDLWNLLLIALGVTLVLLCRPFLD